MNRIDNTALLYACADGIGRLRFARLEKRNALDQASWRALPAAIHRAVEDRARVIIVDGEGGQFCAGADISEFATVRADAASARRYEDDNVAAFEALRAAPVPTVAAIAGSCFGGGLGLAAASDLRVAADDARFAVPAAKLGLAYPASSMGMLVSALGQQMVRDLLFTARTARAEEMLACGFIGSVVSSAELDSVASALASRIAELAPLSHRANKASILADTSETLRQAQARGDATFESADYAEGRKAFRERRPPAFKGS